MLRVCTDRPAKKGIQTLSGCRWPPGADAEPQEAAPGDPLCRDTAYAGLVTAVRNGQGFDFLKPTVALYEALNSSFLLNPGNDARAIGQLLTTAGFKVDLLLDASTAEPVRSRVRHSPPTPTASACSSRQGT